MQRISSAYLASNREINMSSIDYRDDLLDLKLVRSYMPLLMLIQRSMLLVMTSRLASPMLTDSSMFALLSVIVYFDALIFWRDALNRASGFLMPTAFVIYVNLRGHEVWPTNTKCTRSVQLAPYWTADIAWAASSSVVFVSLCMQVPLRVRILHVTVTWSCMALAHIFLGCLIPYDLTELVCRLLLYYVSCAFFFLSSMLLPEVNRNKHSFTVLHVNMHMLFVEPYVLAVSVSISVAAYACIYYQYTARAGGQCDAPCHVTVHAASMAEDRKGLHARPGVLSPTEDLLAELRAAKAAPRESP
jgi:hypothetical protein